MPFFGTPRASTSPGEEGVPLSPYMGTGATPTNRGASLTGRYCEYCAGVGVRPDPSVLLSETLHEAAFGVDTPLGSAFYQAPKNVTSETRNA